jgi:hypothetical protein
LLDWKESSQKRPILLTGGRGVGKSYFVNDFAKAFYTESVYINFEREPYLNNLIFENNEHTIDVWLMERFHITETTESILIILDEINFCKRILDFIAMLTKAKLVYHIIAISSFGCPDHEYNNLFWQVQLSPLDFEEFLIATSNEWYIAVIKEHFISNKKIPNIVHEELLALFQLYLQIGGMPLAVNEFISSESVYNVSDSHRLLINSYLTEVNQRNIDGEALKVNQVFSIIDKQLIKENRKFQYTLIRKGATQAIYGEALQYLQNTYYGLYCYKLDDETLNQFSDLDKNQNYYKFISISDSDDIKLNFKLYMCDVGLLNSTLRPQNLNTNESVDRGIIENYVAQTLASRGYPLYFWESNSQAKIDFIIKKDDSVIPIEVKCNKNTRSKNVSVFKTKCNKVTDCIKISTRNFEYLNNVKYVPIYAVFCI